MKIGTLTVHNGYNFGASLQAYALVKALRKIGAEANLLDYRNEKIENFQNRQKKYGWSSVGQLIRNLRILTRKMVDGGATKRTQKKYLDFHKEVLDTECGTLLNAASFSYVNQIYDGFICGSDQIWNERITGSDLIFFLDFAGEYKIKASYAASLGAPKLNYPENKISEIAHLLGTFNAISIRETINKEEIEQLSGKDCTVVVDPVLLLSPEDWISIANTSTLQIPLKPYAIYYQVLEDSCLYKAARNIAEHCGLPLIRMDWHPLKATLKGCKSLSRKGIGPKEFLKLFLNADLVLSNSFHGTVFSLIFKKQFLTFELIDANSAKNKRLEELLDLTGLRSRLTRNFDVSKLTAIDWNTVNNRLEDRIADSKKFLQSVIKNNEN